MTTFIPFTPNFQQPFQFSATLDGTTYSVIVTWNLFRGGAGYPGYYINILDQSGNWIVTEALVSSPTAIGITLLTYLDGTVTGTTVAAHGWPIGSVLQVTVSNVTPSGYNGVYQVVATGPSSFSYSLSANPGVATSYGGIGHDIDLVGGYFASTMVFRDQTQTFEVSP